MEHKNAYNFLIRKTSELGYHNLAEHIKYVGPLKIITSDMLFIKHLCKIIVGQQLSVASAAAIWNRTEKILDKNNYKKPSIVLDKKFRKAGLSRQKINYLNGIIFDQKLLNLSKKDLLKISKLEYQELLIIIKGIGPWSIDMSRLFYIGDPDIFSIPDLGLKNAHTKIFGKEDYNEDFYKVFSPFRSYMSLFMWRVLEDENLSI